MYTYLKPEDDGLPMREAGAWALEKLDYLSRYVSVFETSMRDKWQVRNYMDLLAGPGKNRIRETGAVVLGSPLLALTTTYPFTGYQFVEYENANAQALRERCSASDLRGQVQIHAGDCNVLVDQIVADLKQIDSIALNVAFLDPEGLELQWATVAKLASVGRMDLIVNYPQYGPGLSQSRRVCHPEAARLPSGVLRPKDPRSREQRPFGSTLRVTNPARLGLSSDFGRYCWQTTRIGSETLRAAILRG